MRTGRFEIEGVSREAVGAFSTRRAETEAAMEARAPPAIDAERCATGIGSHHRSRVRTDPVVGNAVAAFAVAYGRVTGVERVSAGLYRVRVKPKSWRDLTVTLAGRRGCSEAGAVCTSRHRLIDRAAGDRSTRCAGASGRRRRP